MDLFGRYLFRQLAGSFLLILVTLTAIIWLATALTKLDLLTSKGQSFMTMLSMTSLALPALIAIVAPNALLVAALYTFDRLNGDSEVIVMSSAGAPVWRFAMPTMFLAGIVAAVLLVMNLVITPASLRLLREYINQVRTDLISQVLQPGRFSSPETGLTFHIRDRSPDGELIGLVVHDERDAKQKMTYLAERGQIISNSEGSYLVMKDGHIHRQDIDEKNADNPAKSGEVKIVAFEQYIFDITQYGSKTEAAGYRRGELYVSELLNPDPENPDYQRSPERYIAEVHERFSSAIYPLTFIMVVISILGQPRTVRESRWAGIVTAFAVAVGLRAAGLAATNALALNSQAVYLVYGIPIGGIIVAAYAAHVKMVPHTRIRINLDALAKHRILNDKILTVLGVKTEQNGGRVG